VRLPSSSDVEMSSWKNAAMPLHAPKQILIILEILQLQIQYERLLSPQAVPFFLTIEWILAYFPQSQVQSHRHRMEFYLKSSFLLFLFSDFLTPVLLHLEFFHLQLQLL